MLFINYPEPPASDYGCGGFFVECGRYSVYIVRGDKLFKCGGILVLKYFSLFLFIN